MCCEKGWSGMLFEEVECCAVVKGWRGVMREGVEGSL